jgi:hypothetical protein
VVASWVALKIFGYALLMTGKRPTLPELFHVNRHRAFQIAVGRAIHLAHPAHADLRGDFVDAEARAGS